MPIVIDPLMIFGFLLYIAILSLFAIRAAFFNRRKLYPIAIALLLGVLIAFIYSMNLRQTATVMFGILLFNLFLSKELKEIRILVALIGLLFLFVFYAEGPVALSVAMMLGLSSELLFGREYENKVSNREIEIRRDFVHLFGGLVLFVVFLTLGYPLDGYIIQYLFAASLLVVFYAELWRNSRLSMFLYRIEKHKDYVGYGAIWLGIGTLVAYVFMDKSYFLLALLAIYFADPIATFAGSYKPFARLPHNRRKSVVGSLSYFAVVAIPGFFLIGPLSVVFAAVGALVESLPIEVDDNLSVSIIFALMYLVLLYSAII